MSPFHTFLSIGLTLFCLSLRHGDCTSYSFVPYTQQCPSSSSTVPPHLNYEGERSAEGKVLDGLGLQGRVLLNATENANPFVPGIFTTEFTASSLSKLLRLIQQRNFISTLPESERKGYDTVIDLLDTTATEMCGLLQGRLQGQYKPFTCTEADLLDLQARLQYITLLETYYNHGATGSSTNTHVGQCNYWNTRVLQNCTTSYQPTEGQFTVQSSYLVPLYRDSIQTCDCSSSPICQITASS